MAERRGRVSQRDLDELAELMERVGEPEEKVEQTLKVAAANPDTYADLVEMYRLKAAQVATKDDFYPYEELDGGFEIGEDPDGTPVGLTREELNEHLLVVAMTGRGKTTFFYNLMDRAAAEDLPFMVFDFKNDYRHLVDEHDLVVMNWRDMRFNPLEPPPGVAAGKWGEIMADTFAHATDLLLGSESYFLDKLEAVYDLYEVGSTGRYPSLFELRDLVAADEVPRASPRFRYMERVESRLSMLTGFSGDIFDCSSGYPLGDFLERNVVFELSEPNQYVTNFFVEAVLTWIYYYRDAMGHRGDLRHLVLFDEAKRVFDVNRERQPESGFPPIDALVGQVREFGEGLVVADHEPSKLTDSLKANTNAKLWMTLGSGHDVEEMAETFGLDRDETDFTRTMEKGEALLKLADTDPVPVHLPDYEVEKTVSEEEIRTRMAPVLDGFETVDRFRHRRFRAAIGEDVEEGVEDVSEELLASVAADPLMNMTERYEAVGVDTKRGTEVKNELLKLGVVEEVEVQTGTRGRNPKLLELTPEGRAVLADRGYDVAGEAKGGARHRWWQQRVKEHFAAEGYEATIEYAVGPQHIDVYAETAGETVAVEVALSPEHEVENVRKCLHAEMDPVQVAYRDEDVRDRIRSRLEEAFDGVPDEVAFVALTEFT